MNQIRFNIGVPKAGSAARIAEDAAESPSRSMLPRAGSAARDAEERKKAEGVPTRRSVGYSMRATGGRVAGQATPTKAVISTEPVMERSQTISKLSVSNMEQSNISTISPLLSERSESGNVSAGPLQTAVTRFKSLFESLFPAGGSSTKS